MDRFATIEAFQLTINIIGLVYSGMSIQKAARKYRSLVINGVGNGRRTVAVGQLVGESLRFLVHITLGISAFISFALLPTPPEIMGPTIYTWVYVRKVMYFSTACVCVLKTWWYRYTVHLLEAEGTHAIQAIPTEALEAAIEVARRSSSDAVP